MGERDRRDAVELVPAADAVDEAHAPQHPLDREAADGHDERRAQEPELPLTPERAELLLARRGRAVAATAQGTSRIAAGDRRAVEGRVELLLVEAEPAAERPSRTASPGASLDAFDDTGSLPEDVRALAGTSLEDGHRLERISGFCARSARPVVPLERGDRAVGRPAPRQAATATNQRPSWRTRPPPSSAASLEPVK